MAANPETAQKLTRLALTAMVVGSMVGADIFSLPARFGAATGPFGAIIAWLIAGGGMLTLAFVFQSLAMCKPDLDSGIFAYAQAGFGTYLGFAANFGFWAGTGLGNVTDFALIKSTMGALFPVFGDGNTPSAIMVPSVILWAVHFMMFAFDAEKFATSFFGGGDYNTSQVFKQVRSTMLVTVFVFIGIEGASVYSRYSKKREDVGFATVAGFVGVLCLLVLVTLLPYGVLERPELAGMRQPSMAGVMGAVLGGCAVKLAVTRQTYGPVAPERNRDLAWAVIAALNALFMLYAGRLKRILLACILSAPGSALFVIARREQGHRAFTTAETAVFAAVALGGVVGVYAIASGLITI